LQEIYSEHDLHNLIASVESHLDDFAHYERDHDPDDTRLDVIELVLLAAMRSGLILRPIIQAAPEIVINAPGQQIADKLERIANALEYQCELMLAQR
jgi:hypothetical protein